MKSILIFLILYSVEVAKADEKVQNDSIAECPREALMQYVKEHFSKMTDLIDYLKNPTDDTLLCMVACSLWPTMNGKTLNDLFLEFIDTVYARGFKTNKFTRKDVESKIKKCHDQEQDECQFFKCVDPFHLPFVDVLLQDPSVKIFLDVAENYVPSASS